MIKYKELDALRKHYRASISDRKLRAFYKSFDNFDDYTIDSILEEFNILFEMYGIEVMRWTGWDSYYGDTRYIYANTGDTYEPTLGYDTEEEEFFIEDNATAMERMGFINVNDRGWYDENGQFLL